MTIIFSNGAGLSSSASTSTESFGRTGGGGAAVGLDRIRDLSGLRDSISPGTVQFTLHKQEFKKTVSQDLADPFLSMF